MSFMENEPPLHMTIETTLNHELFRSSADTAIRATNVVLSASQPAR